MLHTHTRRDQQEAGGRSRSLGDVVMDLCLFLICHMHGGDHPAAAQQEGAGGEASQDTSLLRRFLSALRVGARFFPDKRIF